jgi:MFS family permease
LACPIPMLPFMIQAYHINYFLAAMIVVLPTIWIMFGGYIGEKFVLPKLGSNPIKKILLLAMMIVTATTVLSPLMPDIWSYLFIRFFYGIGFIWIFTFCGFFLPGWFGIKTIPQLVITGIFGLIVGFFTCLYFTIPLNGLFFGFDWKACTIYFYGGSSLAVTILWALLAKEGGH